MLHEPWSKQKLNQHPVHKQIRFQYFSMWNSLVRNWKSLSPTPFLPIPLCGHQGKCVHQDPWQRTNKVWVPLSCSDALNSVKQVEFQAHIKPLQLFSFHSILFSYFTTSHRREMQESRGGAPETLAEGLCPQEQPGWRQDDQRQVANLSSGTDVTHDHSRPGLRWGMRSPCSAERKKAETQIPATEELATGRECLQKSHTLQASLASA